MFGSSHLFIDDIQPKLELPKLIYDIIKAEEEYQMDIYFFQTFWNHIQITHIQMNTKDYKLVT